MGDTNELMEFLSAGLGATLDEIYQRLIDCDFTREDPGLAMFVVALLNALGREGRGNRPTEVVLMLAFGESGTAERGRNRLMRWRRGEMSGHDLAREPGLGEQRDHRLGEMPLPVHFQWKLLETTSNSDMSEIAIHSLLVDWKQRGLDRETHQDPDRDRYTSDEEGTVVDNAADELELIAVSKRPTRLLSHGTVVRTNLEPSVQEATPLKKI